MFHPVHVQCLNSDVNEWRLESSRRLGGAREGRRSLWQSVHLVCTVVVLCTVCLRRQSALVLVVSNTRRAE